MAPDMRRRRDSDWLLVSGQAVVAYVTAVGEAEPGPDLAADLRDYVGTRIGKFARPKRLIWTQCHLP